MAETKPQRLRPDEKLRVFPLSRVRVGARAQAARRGREVPSGAAVPLPQRCGGKAQCPEALRLSTPSGGFAKALRLPSESAAESVGLGAKTPLGPSLARQVRLSGGLRPLLGPGRAAGRTMPRGPMHAARALWWAGCGSSPSSEDSKRSGAPSTA